jgi:hypothetical protein
MNGVAPHLGTLWRLLIRASRPARPFVAAPARREAIATDAVQTVRQAILAGYSDIESLAADAGSDALAAAPASQLLKEKGALAAAETP